MVGAGMHRLDLQDRVDHDIDGLPAAGRAGLPRGHGEQARASMSSGNSWTIRLEALHERLLAAFSSVPS